MSVVIDGIYEHYKGKKYKIIGVARHPETLEKLVVYQAMYDNNALWVRPYEMFCEKVIKEGKEVFRFRYMGKELDSMHRISLEFPEDLTKDFFDNNIDIEKEIGQDIQDANIEYEVTENKSHKKDVGLVILAAGISVSAILLCISKIIRIVNERPRKVKILEKDEDGNILKEETILLEPQKASQKTEIDFVVGTQNINIKILDESN